MSSPIMKSSSTDIPKDSQKVVDNRLKNLKKSFSTIPPKSRIPKQGKLPVPTTEKASTNESSVGVKQQQQQQQQQQQATEKASEKPPTPVAKLPTTQSKSQEKPPMVTNTRPRTIISMGSDCNERRVLENKFNQKKNRYVNLNREIEDKQKLAVTSFKELFQMRERIISLGGKEPCKLEEISPLGFQLIKPKTTVEGGSENTGTLNEQLAAQLENNLTTIIEVPLKFCRETLSKFRDTVVWLSNFEREFWDDPSPTHCKEEMAHQCESYKAENSAFEKRFESIRQEQLLQIKEFVIRLSFMWHEYNLCTPNPVSSITAASTGTFEENEQEKLREKEKSLKLYAKLRKQETALTNSENKAQKLLETLKHLEKQLKSKETDIQHKDKELEKFRKAHEIAGKSEKQRGTLESRLSKIKEELEHKDKEIKNLTADYMQNVENLNNEIDSEKRIRQDLEYQLNEHKVRYAKLEEKFKEIYEIQKKQKEITSNNDHTEYELQLFSDLKETKNMLAEKEKIIQKLQYRRINMIEGVNDTDQDNNSQNKKLAEEVMNKTNELSTVKSQFAQLQKNYKRMQHKTETLEERLSTINRLHSKDNNRNAYDIQIMQLQQQITDLRSTLYDVNCQNEGLEKTCVQLQIKVEQYKNCVRNQDKDSNKVRKDTQQLQPNENRYPVDPMEQNSFSSISVEEIQRLYSTLENKEMQIMKLEKLVKQMERQEEQSQIQRTRLESKLAKLHVMLKKDQDAHRCVNSKPLPVLGIRNYNCEDFINPSTLDKSTAFHNIKSKSNFSMQSYVSCPISTQLKNKENTFMNTFSSSAPEQKFNYLVNRESKQHIETEYSTINMYKKQMNLEKKQYTNKTKESNKHGFFIYKWFLKPFYHKNRKKFV